MIQLSATLFVHAPNPGSKGRFLVSIRADSLPKSEMETLMGSELPPVLAHRSAKDSVCVTVTL